MKTSLLALALVPLLLVAPTALAQSDETLDCTGIVCDTFCDVYVWIAANPFIHINRYCPIE